MSKQQQHGASLIEALVSILIMSLGLLGIAGLQLNAIAYQKTSWSTHRVAEIANDFAERIRANPTAANSGNYAYTADYATSKAATFTSNNCRTSGSYCSTAQIAADDVAALVTKARAILPGGSAQVTGSSAQGFVVTVMFMDKEFIDPVTRVLLPSNVCNAGTSGIDWRNCCPDTASVPDGVRCRRFYILAGGDTP